MPRRFSSQVTSDTTLVTTAETILVTLVVASVRGSASRVQLAAKFDLTIGTNGTGFITRWRRGATITDTVVGESNTDQIATAAASTEDHVHMVEDTPGEVANQTYVFTVQQVAATANGTAVFAVGWADVDF